MDQEKKKMGMGKKLGIGCLGLIVLFILIGVIVGATGKKDSNTDTVSAPASNSNTTTNKPAAQTSTIEKITLSNATAKSNSFGGWEVVGEAKNNDSITHSFTVKATFYDAAGKILGTAVGAVNDLSAGDTKTYNLISTDSVTGYKDLKVQVDTLL